MSETKNKREDAIKELHAKMTELQQRRNELKQDIQAIERAIALLSHGHGMAPIAALVAANPNILTYSQLKAQGAVERLLKESPKRKFRPSQFKKELLRRGYEYSGKSPLVTIVTSALNRAAKKGIATKEKQNGRWTYSLKEEPKAELATLGSNP